MNDGCAGLLSLLIPGSYPTKGESPTRPGLFPVMPPVDVAQARWPFCCHEKILSKMDFRWEPYFIQRHRPHCIVTPIRCSVWEQTRHGLVVLLVSLPLFSSSIGHQIIMTNLNICSSIKICIFYCEILIVYILKIWEILNQIILWDLHWIIIC